jgi:uncharacterized membrane protein (UPF0127 family)
MRPRTSAPAAAVLIAAALAAGCGRAGGGDAARPAAPGAAVVLPSGARYVVEIAATPELREQGLMYRESLAPGHGMLFLFPAPTAEEFWMKNCNFAIDIVWMNPHRRVTFVSSHTPPCREDPCPTYGPSAPALYVLEIPDGAAAREGIVAGATIRFEGVPPLPRQ